MSNINNAPEDHRATTIMMGNNRATRILAAIISRATRQMAVVCNDAISKMGEIRSNNLAEARSINNSVDTANNNQAAADLYSNKTADTTLSSSIFSSIKNCGMIIKINGDMEGKIISV